MTVFTTANVPPAINTLERLAAWVGLALRRVNPAIAVLETPGAFAEPVAQTALLRADDGTLRLIVRLSLEVDPAYAENTDKFWMNVKELSATTLPTAFTSN